MATILTQVVIDKNDAAFQNPSKPIGAHYTEQTAQKLMAESGHVYVEDAGRGIACGGGGIPVVAKDGFYQSVDAVIDKDYAAAKLAELLEADFLFILTAVDRVSLNYRKIDEKTLNQITIAEAQEYIKQGHFAPGSMLPKVEAGILFAQSGNGRKAIIGSLEKTSEALAGKSGTIITDT